MDEGIEEFLRNTKFIVLVNYGGVIPNIPGLSIKLGKIIWVDKVTAYHMLDKHSGRHPNNFKEIPPKDLDASHLKDVYDKLLKIDPLIKEELTKQQIFHYLIENPKALLEILKGNDVKAGIREKEDTSFSPSPDYSTVKVRGKTFHLTHPQAQVIKMLHTEYMNQGEDGILSKKHILKQVNGVYPNRVQEIFRTNRQAFKELIECIKKPRGHYRLKR